MKKIAAILTALALLLSTAACSAGNSEQGASQSDPPAQTTKAQSASVSVKDYGFSSMNPYDETLKLTDSQRKILTYFNNNYIDVDAADAMMRNPKQFREMKITVSVCVQKILESDDQSYTIVGRILQNNASEVYSDESGEADYNSSVVITGPQLEQRLMVGDYVSFCGVYEDVRAYTVDGTSYQLPTVKIYDSSLISYGDSDEAKLDATAKALFGKDVTVRESKEGIDYESGDIHGYEYFMVIEPTDADDENAFEIYVSDPRIVKKGSTANSYVTVKPAADFEHFYFFTENRTAKTGKIEYMTKDFKPVWSVTVEDTSSFVYDYSRSIFVYMMGSDLHLINVSDGKEKTQPVYVGERDRISIADDGCAILTGKGEKDNVIKVDSDGKILWRASIPLGVTECRSIQVKSDSSVIAGLLDEFNSLNIVRIEPDGSFGDPIYVYSYGIDEGY